MDLHDQSLQTHNTQMWHAIFTTPANPLRVVLGNLWGRKEVQKTWTSRRCYWMLCFVETKKNTHILAQLNWDKKKRQDLKTTGHQSAQRLPIAAFVSHNGNLQNKISQLCPTRFWPRFSSKICLFLCQAAFMNLMFELATDYAIPGQTAFWIIYLNETMQSAVYKIR